MQKITVKKSDLLTTLRENRETHIADFEIAWEAYHKKVIANVTALLDNAKHAKQGEAIQLHIGLVAPTNHAAEYDRAMEMIEWETSDEVELSESDFMELIQDDWGWKHQFAATNTMYTGSASPSSLMN